MIRLHIATMQYSSLCVNIENGVRDSEQVDSERDKVNKMGEKQERDKHKETTNARSDM